MSDIDQALDGRLVLLAQGEPFQSSYLAWALQGAGATVLGPVRTNEELSALLNNLRDLPSAAVIDVKLLNANSRELLDSARGGGMVVVSTVPRGADSDADFVAPFGAFQIVEALAARLTQAS